jgi:hypothetical protein
MADRNYNDNSRGLKTGEIKQILIQVANDILPDFQFLTYKKRNYIFQRIRLINNLKVYEMLYIVFYLKDRAFDCSIASLLNPKNIFANGYNGGLINPHRALKVLVHNSGALDIQDAYYFHNGQVETTIKTVKEIFEDYKKYGIPYLNRQFERLQSSQITIGLDYINQLDMDKETLKKEITDEIKQGRVLITHPVHQTLKAKLQSISGQSREDRQWIPITTLELLELYWTS